MKTAKSLVVRKQINKALRVAQEQAKADHCILCGQKVSSFCNSHSVPKMVLRNIADNGHVLQANVLFGIDILDLEKGINNSGTFHIICKNCDSKYFQDYENQECLKEAPTDVMLAEIALKDALIQLYKRRLELKLSALMQNKTGAYLNFEDLELLDHLDIKEFEQEVSFYAEILKNKTKGGFQLLFWKKLPYRTPIATQGMIALTEDREKNIINNIWDFSENVRMEYIHLAVFPLEDETIVLAFYHKRNKKLRKLRHQFNSSSISDNLKYLNWLVFKYSENYYFSKSVEKIVEKNAALKELSCEYNGYPNFGLVNVAEKDQVYRQVGFDEIPNFLDIEYAEHVDG